jgi:NADPH2:quinone reductase
MKAVVVVNRPGHSAVEVQSVADPEPGAHDLLVAVRAAGLNRTDLARRQQHFAARSNGADIAGLELAGEVIGLGDRVEGFSIGDRIMAMARDAYAELAVVDHRLALRVPDGMDWAQAAAFPTWFLTAHDALKTNAKLQRGEAVLIQGASAGVGIAAIQVAKWAGAGVVIGTSRSASKLQQLEKTFGLDVGIDTTRESVADRTRAVTAGRGADVVLDHIGASAIAENMDAASILGRVVSIGRLSGKVGEIDLDLLSLKRISLIGVTFRTRSLEEKRELQRRAMDDLGEGLRSGDLHPHVDRTFPLSEAMAAQDYMASNAHLGKIVLLI